MIEKEFGIISMQSAFFLGALDVKNKLEFAQDLISSTAGILNGDPLLLPIPGKLEDYPAELPFIILKSKDDNFSCNIAKGRIDFLYKGKPETRKNISEFWPEYQKTVSDITKFIRDVINERIWRLGFVVVVSREFNESINALLMKNYLKPGIFEKPYEIQLNILNKLTYEQVDLNRWIKLRPVRETQDPTKDYNFLIEVDINTISEKSYAFEGEQIERFFIFSHSHIVSEIPKYILVED